MTRQPSARFLARFAPGPLLHWAAARQRAILILAFLIQSLGVVMTFAVEVPFGRSPDEPAHVARAQTVRHGQVIGRREIVEREAMPPEQASGGRISPVLLKVSFLATLEGVQPSKITQDLIAFNRGLRWDQFPKRQYFSLSNTIQYPPTLYVPAALAFYAAEKSGASPYQTMLAGRIVNAAAFVTVGLAALALAQAGALVIFVVLSLPMTLFLGGTVNQDGLMIAVAALAAALCSRLSLDRPTDLRVLAGLLIAALAFVGARPVYITLLPLLFWPDLRLDRAALRQGLRTRLACFLLVVAAVGVWSWIVARYVRVPFLKNNVAYESGPLATVKATYWTTDPAAQIQILLHDPLVIFRLIWNALDPGWVGLVQQMVGVLGILDIMLPPWMYTLFYAAFALAVLGDMLARKAATLLHTLIYLVLVAGAVFLIFVLQYVTWTDVGRDVVEGVQGRYMLPMLVFAGLFAPCLIVPAIERAQTALRGALVLAVAAVPSVNMLYLPRLILDRYYLQ